MKPELSSYIVESLRLIPTKGRSIRSLLVNSRKKAEESSQANHMHMFLEDFSVEASKVAAVGLSTVPSQTDRDNGTNIICAVAIKIDNFKKSLNGKKTL